MNETQFITEIVSRRHAFAQDGADNVETMVRSFAREYRKQVWNEAIDAALMVMLLSEPSLESDAAVRGLYYTIKSMRAPEHL